VTEASIKALFDPLGTVELVNYPRRRGSGQPRGFAFVDMSTAEEMHAAMAALDGQALEGRIMRVSQSVPKEDVPNRPVEKKPDLEEGFKKIYMGNIPFECTKEEILEFFSGYEVTEVYIPFNVATGTGRGFAFVTMKDEDADRAIEATNEEEFGGRKVIVSVPLPAGKKAPERYSDRVKLYIGNLSFYTVKDTLREIFEEFGTVHDCYMPEDTSTGGSRGFGFVTMEKDAANNAIKEIDGCEVDGRIIRVNEAQPKKVSYADPE
jgi:RNA recognition motif-containing protein